MADVKISELPTGSALTSDDLMVIVDSGSLTTQQINVVQLLQLATGSGGSPAGSTGYIQINSGSVFATGSNLFWDYDNDRLGVGTSNPSRAFEVEENTNGNAGVLVSNLSTGTSATAQISARNNNNVTANIFAYGSNHTSVAWNLSTTLADSAVFAASNTAARHVIGSFGPADTLIGGNFNNAVNDAAIKIDGTNHTVVINDGGNSTSDFRVEGDTEPNLLFVDASTDRVGIGTSTPENQLTVREDFNGTTSLSSRNSNSGTSAVASFVAASNSAAIQHQAYSSGHLGTIASIPRADSIAILDSTSLPSARFIIGNMNNTPLYFIQNDIVRQTFDSSEVVFNDTGVVYDFRVEGDTEPNLLFVDAGTDRVGIGTSSPTARLNVVGSFIQDGGAIFNEAGGNVDFRVEGDTEPNLLFVDAGTDRVGIGTNTPSRLLHTQETVNGTTGVLVDNLSTGTSAQAALSVRNNSGVTAIVLAYGSNSATVVWNGTAAADTAIFAGNSAAARTIIGSFGAADTLIGGNFNNAMDDAAIKIDGTNHTVVINDGANPETDFRVEGDTEPNLLFVDASTDRVGIGTNVPDSKLHVLGAAGEDELFLVENDIDTIFSVIDSDDGGAGYVVLPVTGGVPTESKPDGAAIVDIKNNFIYVRALGVWLSASLN